MPVLARKSGKRKTKNELEISEITVRQCVFGAVGVYINEWYSFVLCIDDLTALRREGGWGLGIAEECNEKK